MPKQYINEILAGDPNSYRGTSKGGGVLTSAVRNINMGESFHKL